MRAIDLTHTIAPGMPVYPGTEPPVLSPGSTYARDGFRETRLTLFSHTGTHMDAPAHLFPDRTALDALPAAPQEYEVCFAYGANNHRILLATGQGIGGAA